jgi:hypothetical protein
LYNEVERQHTPKAQDEAPKEYRVPLSYSLNIACFVSKSHSGSVGLWLKERSILEGRYYYCTKQASQMLDESSSAAVAVVVVVSYV